MNKGSENKVYSSPKLQHVLFTWQSYSPLISQANEIVFFMTGHKLHVLLAGSETRNGGKGGGNMKGSN